MVSLQTGRYFLLFATMSNGVQASAAVACWIPNEIVAAQVKDFQCLLMVGTLRCRASNPAVETSYNAFVTRHKGTLNSSAIVLKAHFLREIGIASGQEAYDQHATTLSNNHSARQDAPSFCPTIDLYSRMAALASDENFVIMARTAVDAPTSGVCPPAVPNAVVARAPDMAVAALPDASPPPGQPLPPESDPAVAALPPAAAAPLPPEATATPIAAAVPASAPPAAVAPAAVAPPPGTTVIAAAPIVPPQSVDAPAAPDRASVRAFQDAVKALQAATEALAAQQLTPI